jgi:mono/diheme cytochrome c family protein
LTVVLSLFTSTASAAPDVKAGEYFENHVRPVLLERCVGCHGPNKQESGLRLDSRDSMLKGGQSGPAIIAGKPDDSLLIEAVRREGLEMPPDVELPPEEVAALETWVRSGAVWPGGAMPSADITLGDQKRLFKEAKTHWAFQPVKKPPIPAVENEEWCQTPVDRFIMAKLEADGMQPAPPADRRTLLRRLTFDLIGLPPTEQEILDFQNDKEPRAIQRVVDRLLASPHYGERWGRHWLDIARYADMRDFLAAGADRRYPYAYTYRDWVIKAINDDMPYDEFIRQQLAADSYAKSPDDPNLAALGLLTVGPRFNNNVNEQIADRIDVVCRGFLGLAVTCARCHDHKYDPIPTTDYYALYGVFASCEEPKELPTLKGLSPPAKLVAEYEAARAAAEADYEKYSVDLRTKAYVDLRANIKTYMLGYYEMGVTKERSIRDVIDKLKVSENAMTPLADNLDRMRRDTKWQSDPVLGPLFSLLPVIDKNFAGKRDKILKFGKIGEKDSKDVNPIVLKALQDARPSDKQALLATYGEILASAQEAWQQQLKKSPKATALPDADLEQVRQALYREDGPFAFTPVQVRQAARLFGNARTLQAKYESAIKEVDAAHPGAPAKAFVLVDKEKLVDPFVLIRGEANRRGEKVSRRFLTVLDPKGTPFATGSGRKELAEHIADRDNPLTARVFVNRVWMHHFGDGLVTTPGDFGFRSNKPSHSELLDWLAAEFMNKGWSLKQLHRTLVLSSVYRQSSRTVPEYQVKDPENRLLSHANRRRLEFEAMRDSMLYVAGQLDESVGGRSVALSEPPFTPRRTVYAMVDRLNIDPIFTVFDFASPDVSTPERPQTTVPQQALFGMNHPFVTQQARAMIKLPEVAAASDDIEKIRALYGRVFGRKPLQPEVKVGRMFLAAAEREQANSQPKRLWQYGYGPADTSLPADERFTPVKMFINGYYQPSETHPDPVIGHLRLNKNGGHPGKGLDNAAILRWRAPYAVTVKISGTFAHLSDKGDGIRARIIGPDNQPLGEWKALNDKHETTVKRVRVPAGGVIDFVVDCVKTTASDAYQWTPKIEAIAEAGSSAGNAPAADAEVWDARADFAPPPPPPLGPWEQLAQALLLTNEFLFVD